MAPLVEGRSTFAAFGHFAQINCYLLNRTRCPPILCLVVSISGITNWGLVIARLFVLICFCVWPFRQLFEFGRALSAFLLVDTATSGDSLVPPF